MDYTIVATVTPIVIAIATAVHYYFKSMSRIDLMQNQIEILNERLDKLETSISQDLRDLTHKLDRIIYQLAAKAIKTDE